MNLNNFVRRAFARTLGLPWRQIRYRVVPDAICPPGMRLEVEHGGRWRVPPDGWQPPLFESVGQAAGWLLKRALRIVAPYRRLASAWGGFDRCLGGGLVRRTRTLLSGGPGSGKTLVALKAAGALAHAGVRVLYATAEEALESLRASITRLRAMGVRFPPSVALLASADWGAIEAEAGRVGAEVVFLDTANRVALDDGWAARSGLGPASTRARLHALMARVGVMVRTSRRSPAVVLLCHVNERDRLLADTTVDRVLQHDADAIVRVSRVGDAIELRTTKNRNGPDGVRTLLDRVSGRLREFSAP